MYNQKYKPQPYENAIYEAYDQSDAESQPLVQQVDPTYQPTEKQVREYAIETLGMNLPKDQGLLYLARQGLKAPIPPNWVPYQSRNGQVYYKHRITQQKMYDHPTDVQYRKKYEQALEKMTRKNLKSMSNPTVNPLSSPAFGLGGGLNPSSFLKNSGASNLVQQSVSLDPDLQIQYQEQVHQLQQKLLKQYKQFQKQSTKSHESKLKKLKQQFEQNLENIYNPKSNAQQSQSKLQKMKQDLKTRIQQKQRGLIDQEINQYQKAQEKKMQEFQTIYQEDNKIKVNTHMANKEKQYEKALAKFQEEKKKHQKKMKQLEIQKKQVLTKKKEEYMKEGNNEIQSQYIKTFEQTISKLKDEYSNKLQNERKLLEQQYHQTRKMLGQDPTDMLKQLADKKDRLMKISQQKLTSYRNKQIQALQHNSKLQLQKSKRATREQFLNKLQQQKQKIREQNEQKLQKLKKKLISQTQQKIHKTQRNLQEENQRRLEQYRNSMNKKISKIREDIINSIEKESQEGKNGRITNKILIKQKQQQLANKQKIMENLNEQINMENIQLKGFKLIKELRNANHSTIDAILQSYLKQLNIQYHPKIYQKHHDRYMKLKNKYQYDKEFLAQIMKQIQNNAILPFYQRNKAYNQNPTDTSPMLDAISTSSAVLIKKYNQDVRTMRENADMLRQYEIMLKKIQTADQKAIQQLEQNDKNIDNNSPQANSFKYSYKNIELRKDIGLSNTQIQDLSQYQQDSTQNRMTSSYPADTYQDVINNHSRFLANMKSELNRKLYQVRSFNYMKY